MRVLVACEFSGVVRDAFISRGHHATSCDILPSELPGPHLIGDVRGYIERIAYSFDMMIAFPPCTHLCVSGARWFKDKKQEQKEAIAFVETLWNANIPRIAIENPIGVLSTRSRLGKPTQIIQPWQHSHCETKATCLWLKNLPSIYPSNNVRSDMLTLPKNKINRIHHMPPGPDRAKERSRTYWGIAQAFAQQWGNL
jgi:hypothetical protein